MRGDGETMEKRWEGDEEAMERQTKDEREANKIWTKEKRTIRAFDRTTRWPIDRSIDQRTIDLEL